MTILTSIQGGTNTGIDQLSNWTRSGPISQEGIPNCPDELNPFFVTLQSGTEFRYNHTVQSGSNIPVAEYEFASLIVLGDYVQDDTVFEARQGGIDGRGLEIIRTAGDLQVILTRDNGAEVGIPLGSEIEAGTPFHMTVRILTNIQSETAIAGAWEVWINGERKGFQENVNWSTDSGRWNNWNSTLTGAPLSFVVDASSSTTAAWNHLVFRDGFSTAFGTEPEYIDAQEDNTAVVVPQSFFSGHWGLAPPPPPITYSAGYTSAFDLNVFFGGQVGPDGIDNATEEWPLDLELEVTIPPRPDTTSTASFRVNHNLTRLGDVPDESFIREMRRTPDNSFVTTNAPDVQPGAIVTLVRSTTTGRVSVVSFIPAPDIPTFLRSPLI